MDSLQLEANQLILGRSTISICRMIQYSYCIIGILTIETVHLPESVAQFQYFSNITIPWWILYFLSHSGAFHTAVVSQTRSILWPDSLNMP